MFFLSCKTGGFFYPKTTVANNHDEIPYQPVLWHVFTSILDKKNRKFRLEIAKSIEKIEEEIEQQNVEGEVSYYLHKKSMSICCETSTMTETLARKLLKSTDWLMDEHFFQNNGLRELGWCSHYMLDRRSYNYHKNNILKKLKLWNFIGLIVRQIDLRTKKLFLK